MRRKRVRLEELTKEEGLEEDSNVQIYRRDQEGKEGEKKAEISTGLTQLDMFYQKSGTEKPSGPDTRAFEPGQYETEKQAERSNQQQTVVSQSSDQTGFIYRGAKSYHQYKPSQSTSKQSRAITGPMPAGPSNIRNTVRFDYAPDLCKDYNETGYCGFGDSCKFIHDRGDYKSGWELEQEWEAEQQRKRFEQAAAEQHKDSEEVVEDSTNRDPIECAICNESFKPPIVLASCSHWFCEQCALRRLREKAANCPLCQTRLTGQFKIVKQARNKP